MVNLSKLFLTINMDVRKLKKKCLFLGKCFNSFSYISILLSNYTQMKIAHLSRPQQDMSLIREGCDSLGKTSLKSLVGNHWATGGLRANSSSVKGGLKSFSLFLLEENAILPMTAKAGCLLPWLHSDNITLLLCYNIIILHYSNITLLQYYITTKLND